MGSVVVVGGGYGGIAVARELDADVDVTLVEPRECFVHNVAALRGLVDPEWARAMFLPYTSLLGRGEVRRDRATGVEVDDDGVTVELASGGLRADLAVLATGSGYPFPAKIDADDGVDGVARLAAARDELVAASSVLILGAGPAGLELAGEIRAAHPDVAITVIDRGATILPGPLPDTLREEVLRQLGALGVEVVLGADVATPPTAPGVHDPFVVHTGDGRRVAADLWYRCHGTTPTTGYLSGALASARRHDWSLEVTDELLLAGQRRVFAIGDVTAVPEAKMAKSAELHASVVAANIRALLAGATTLTSYRPGPPGISLPLGPGAGASYSEATGVLGAEPTVRLKGAGLRLALYREKLGLG